MSSAAPAAEAPVAPKKISFARPRLYTKQEAAIYEPKRFSWIEAGTKCFSAGTLVSTDNGHIPIEKISTGDRVLTWDGSKYVHGIVLRRFDNVGVWSMIRIITRHGHIECTTDHEFRTDTGWIAALELARRAMENKRRSGVSILREQSREDGVKLLPWIQGEGRNPASRLGCGRLLADYTFSSRKVSSRKGSSGRSGNLDWRNGWDDGESQELHAIGQFPAELGSGDNAGEYSPLCTIGPLWEIERQYQWKLEANRGAGEGNSERVDSARRTAAGLGQEVRRGPHNYPAHSKGRLEARCLTEGEILGYECKEFVGTLHDLEVIGSKNYCVTEQNISVHNSGKTSGCIAWLCEQAVKGLPGHQFWWVAPVYPQAEIAFRRTVRALNPDSFTKNESKLSVTFIAAQTTIVFKSGEKPDNLYGEDVYAVVIDEASRMREEAWVAIRSTLTATQGAARIIGNVKGRKNWFYREARNAANGGAANSAFHRITCWDAIEAGILDRAEIEDARRVLPPNVFKQLYEAEAADDEGNPFGLEAIRALTVDKPSDLPPVLWGWDFAKSNDWTVGVGLDIKGNVARIVRFQAPWGPTKVRVKLETGSARALGDSTGVGDPIVEDLQRENMAIEGYKFTSASKQQLMEGLAADIQQQKGLLPRGVLVDELEIFEYEYTATGVRYSAPSGMHDDCVCAYALARMLYRKGYGEPFVYSRIGYETEGGVFRSRALFNEGAGLRNANHVQMVE